MEKRTEATIWGTRGTFFGGPLIYNEDYRIIVFWSCIGVPCLEKLPNPARSCDNSFNNVNSDA